MVLKVCSKRICNARVAQWWSIALPRRGSRVRIPSRAFNNTKKEISVGYLLFCMFKTCRARTVRISAFHSGRRRRTSGVLFFTGYAMHSSGKNSLAVGLSPYKIAKINVLASKLAGRYFYYFPWLVAFTNFSQKISTQLLTWLIISVILQTEQRKKKRN